MTKEVKGFDACFKEALEKNGIDQAKIKSNQQLMMMCIDLYYMGQLDGVTKLSNALKEKTNVAVPPVCAPALS